MPGQRVRLLVDCAKSEDDACEVRHILDRVGDKWSLLVIALLGSGTRRFGELKREIDEISQRMLTLTLRHLERDGLVERTVFPEIPPRVEYRLTPLGRTLLETIHSLIAWTQAHREEIVAARARYDERTADDTAKKASTADSVPAT